MDTIFSWLFEAVPSGVLSALIVLVIGGMVVLSKLVFSKIKKQTKEIDTLKKEKQTSEDNTQNEMLEELRKQSKDSKEFQKKIATDIEEIKTSQRKSDDYNKERFDEIDNHFTVVDNNLALSNESDIALLKDRINYLSLDIIKKVNSNDCERVDICMNQMAIIKNMFDVYDRKGGNSGINSVVESAESVWDNYIAKRGV